jgi:hypothetical protein
MALVVIDLTTPTITDLTTPTPDLPDYNEEADRLAEELHYDICMADRIFGAGSHQDSIEEAITLAWEKDTAVSSWFS